MSLETLTAEMRRTGIRRLAVLSGEAEWCRQQAQQWRIALSGEWITLSEASDLADALPPSALRNLLGQEFRHAIF
ncbi:hypothetical protein HA40_13885 [Mixta calida]|nr:hypothetical protein HA40_13885 [Mixta calida]